MLEGLVSFGTALTLVAGVAIGGFYLRHMAGALRRAVRARDDADVGEDRYRFGLLGAVVAVVGSASAIAVYGVGPGLLYLGPALALASALAVGSCLRREEIGR